MLATCHRPRRRGRGGESDQVAAARGRLDAVIAGLLFMGGLRRSEVSALRWADVEDAGLDRRVTAHSGRVGVASELTSRGASTTDVMLAGNWKTSRMVAHYSAGATATRGAVARYL